MQHRRSGTCENSSEWQSLDGGALLSRRWNWPENRATASKTRSGGSWQKQGAMPQNLCKICPAVLGFEACQHATEIQVLGTWLLRDTDAGELSRILDETGWTAGIDPALASAGIANGS